MKSKKVITIVNVALRQVIGSAFNVVLPFVVIHFSSKEVWGEFVSVLLFILIAGAFTNYGNKEFLLRSFSTEPKSIRKHFSEAFCARLLLLFFSGIATLFLFPFNYSIFVIFGLLGIYVSQSYEAIIVYEKRFMLSALIESGFGIILITSVLGFREELDSFLLIMLYGCFQLLKAIVYTLFFWKNFERKPIVANWYFFKKGLPFFLLTLMGFLASKTDVYLVSFFLSKSILAEYQIINNLCLFAMGTAGFFYTPFTKNIYRNNEAIIGNMRKTLLILGIAITMITIIMMWMVVHFYLKTVIPDYFYLAVGLYVFPSFVYGIQIVNLYKHHLEMKVVRHLFTGIIINVVMTALFLYFGMGVTGAMFGSAIAQVVVLLLFLLTEREYRSLIESKKLKFF